MLWQSSLVPGFRVVSGFAITNVVYKDNGNNLAGSGHVLFENDASHSKIDGIFRATAYRGVQIAGTCGNIRVDGVFAGITFEDVFTSSSNANVTIGGVWTDQHSPVALNFKYRFWVRSSRSPAPQTSRPSGPLQLYPRVAS